MKSRAVACELSLRHILAKGTCPIFGVRRKSQASLAGAFLKQVVRGDDAGGGVLGRAAEFPFSQRGR